MTATLALIIALGGTSYAAVKVTGRNVVDGSITSADVRNSSLRGKDIRNKSITGDDVRDGTISGADLRRGSIPVDRLRGTLPATQGAAAPTPAPAAVLGAGAVTGDKLALGSVTPAHEAPIPAVRLGRTGALDLPNDTLVAVPFDREIDDPLDLHGPLTPTVTTAPIAGVYMISAGAWISGSTGGSRRYASLVVNGATNIASQAVRPVSANNAPTILSVATTRRLAAGDQITLTVLQNSGSTLKLDSGAEHTSLALAWLGP
ncbi:MAG: hypothetical protein JHC95_18215 [Solirubrobacteraceae bacterium]|nr:hypothetical protein [Solirubrobacteraceae bacterium]